MAITIKAANNIHIKMSKNHTITEEAKNDVEKAAKGSGISLLGNVVGKSLFFFIQLIIVRLLGAEVFGLYVLGLALVRVVEVISRAGLDIGSIRYISIYNKNDDARLKGTILSALGISLLGSIVMGTILFFSAGFIAESLFYKSELKTAIHTFAICVPFMSLTIVSANATQGFHTTKYAVFIKEIFQPIINLLLIFAFSITGLGLMGVVYAFAISYFLAFFLSIGILNKIYMASIVKKTKAVFDIKGLFVYSLPLIFISLMNYLIMWTDILMLGHFVSSKDISIYRIASLVPLLLVIVLNSTNSIYAPIVADLSHKGEKDRLESMLKITTRWIFNITLPSLIIIVFSSKIIMAIFGAEFVEKGTPILITLALAQFINCITGGVGFTLIMTGKQNLELLNSVFLLALNIILNYILIPKYGIFGAAIASGIAISAVKFLRLFEVYYLYRIHPYNKHYITGFVAAGISLLFLFILGNISFLNGISFYILGIIVILTAFFISFFFSTVTEEDKYIFHTLKAKFSRILIKEKT